MRSGKVYTETVVHLAPERFAAEAPYQVAIIELDGGESGVPRRLTARIEGERVAIDDRVVEVGIRDGVAYFTKRR